MSILPSNTRRVYRLAFGVGLATFVSHALAPDYTLFFVLSSLFLLMAPGAPPTFGKLVKLLLILVISLGWGIVLGSLIREVPVAGILLTFLGLALTISLGLKKPQLAIVSLLFTVGQTLVAALATQSGSMAMMVLTAMVLGFIFAFCIAWVSHLFFLREDVTPPSPPLADINISWTALRAAIIMIPPFIMVLNDLFFIPLLIKGSLIAQQPHAKNAWTDAKELTLATLIGATATLILWEFLKLWPNLLFLSLCLSLCVYLLACPLYRAVTSRYNFAFWQNALVTVIILIIPAVQDSATSDDIDTKMWIRIALFFAVSLYATFAVYLLDGTRNWVTQWRNNRTLHS